MLPSIEPGQRSVLLSNQLNPDRSVSPKSARVRNSAGFRTGTISAYMHTVNARLDRVFDSTLAHCGAHASQSNDILDEDPVDKGRFDEIFKQIEILKGEEVEGIKTLSQGVSHEDFCLKNRHKTYRIALPPKPIQMNVQVTNLGYKESASSSVGSITLSCSVDSEKPSGRSHNSAHNSGDQSISHVHAYVTSQVDGDGCLIDRRKVAPLHKWLFVSVQVAWADCKYFIRVSTSSVAIKLTKREMKLLNDSMKASSALDKKIDKIKNDENETRDLLQRCEKHRKKKHGDKNIVEANKNMEQVADPRSKYIQKVIKTIQKCQREDQVAKRQQHKIDAQVQRAEEWVHSVEIRAERREEEARQAYAEEQHLQRIRMWQVFIMLHSSVCLTAERFAEEKVYRAFLQLRIDAANKIQRMVLHVTYARRRVQCYSNVVRLRTGLSVYIRHLRAFTFLAAGNCLGHMLRNSFIEYSLDVRTAMKKLRWGVLTVQRRWMRLKSIRQARIEVYSGRFRELERSSDPELRSPVPDVVMHHVLMELVCLQQERWVQAHIAYNESKKTVDDNAAVAFLTDEVVLEKPDATAFKLQPGQLEELVTHTQERVKAGEFADLLANHVKKEGLPTSLLRASPNSSHAPASPTNARFGVISPRSRHHSPTSSKNYQRSRRGSKSQSPAQHSLRREPDPPLLE
eukprot:gnl/MRDRNA2_/MRDRNA2_18854_c0_seq1.p1 gnl/MRDRNA2_/MRDRNA2_18854_c0~~gnl/MRDRNA2_/MRDRNA2_18854_c0_seq1.p1  ORF type:complete len:684 (-),score=117.01 gnl/MRDRNA2_/MRDRNA2_18854_c0_seq1:67-2118(-)